MKLHLFLPALSVMLTMLGGVFAEAPLPQALPKTSTIQAVVDLIDGSRIVGTPLEKSLPMTLSYANPSVPLEVITRCEIKHSPESATLFLQNGDRISGSLGVDAFPLETLLGRLLPKFPQIDRIEFSLRSNGPLTAGKGEITLGGVKWEAWRTRFEQQGNRLVALPEAREGFNYGHNGNGRGAQVTTNIGEKEWTDYRIDVDFCMTGINPGFNPHGLPPDYRSGCIMFHVAAASESWNVAHGTTCYSLNLNADGSWNLGCIYDNFCKSDCGFGNPHNAGTRTLASGKGLKLNFTDGNHFRIEIVATRIAIWVDHQLIADLRDEKMGEVVAGKDLTSGGVGFGWGWESLGWIENFSATRL